MRAARIVAEVMDALAERFEHGAHARLGLVQPRSHDPELAGRCALGPPEDRGRHIGGSPLPMRVGEPSRGRGRDRAHREVQPAGTEPGEDAALTEHHVLERSVVGEQGEHDAVSGQRGLGGAPPHQRRRFVRSAIVDSQPVARVKQPVRHAGPHLT